MAKHERHERKGQIRLIKRRGLDILIHLPSAEVVTDVEIAIQEALLDSIVKEMVRESFSGSD